ncbi:MAG: MoaD/ThiS family protein [Desulfopila sp.]
MRVFLKISQVIGHYAPGHRQFVAGADCDLAEGATVADLLVSLSLPVETRLLIFVNGSLAERGCSLCHGDRVYLSQMLAGG